MCRVSDFCFYNIMVTVSKILLFKINLHVMDFLLSFAESINECTFRQDTQRVKSLLGQPSKYPECAFISDFCFYNIMVTVSKILLFKINLQVMDFLLSFAKQLYNGMLGFFFNI